MADRKGKRGRPPFQPTPEQREMVRMHVAVGLPHDDIARIVINPSTGKGIGRATLDKYFREELDTGSAKANADVGGKLYTMAMEGNLGAIIFWLKTRAGYRETSVHELKNADGDTFRTTEVSEEEYLTARKRALNKIDEE